MLEYLIEHQSLERELSQGQTYGRLVHILEELSTADLRGYLNMPQPTFMGPKGHHGGGEPIESACWFNLLPKARLVRQSEHRTPL